MVGARDGAPVWRHVDVAKLHVRDFSDAFLEAYLDAEWPAIAGCVGCFRIEGPGVQLFSKVEGSQFTDPRHAAAAVARLAARCGRDAGMTAPYAEVIGDPIAQSKSPMIHRFWLEALGLPGEYRACHVLSDGLADYLASRRHDPDWRGCNVTMPHKQAVLPLLDRLDLSAARIGAVNTIVPDGAGGLIGTTPMVLDFSSRCVPSCAASICSAWPRILGTGGAARGDRRGAGGGGLHAGARRPRSRQGARAA